MALPTVVFVPGAWITPAFYGPFLKALTDLGYPVVYADYPSLEPSDPVTADCKTDAEAISRILLPLIEDEGRDVLLVMHSYAGMPGAAAAKGLSKTERTQGGQSGGVLGMVFIAAFLVPEGLSCAGLQGGNLPPWILLDQPSADLNLPEDPVGNFAPDVDQALLQDLADHIKPHSTLAFKSPQPSPAWADEVYTGRVAFIVTTADKAVPKEAQHGMIGATQRPWIVRELECSHCAPFINRIDETVREIQALQGEFERL
ncbi:alpha/beta hydrolase [Aspergillus clavatus NRRL 1]|uniref:AB hydrolase-1 domain-containing protein n=1 Tax=Aspergillus clavatus (strain ATCC 1007 / CBS 513.65 / DSM 816 / NCTC 3887 / NRRL 1 / QM 1276 / 107) TaxID=344612 RepID=A1CCQ2_ASPCL|nr:uncharacterized protein ACLA_062740 [Aspergillus clavatus NRRL 1]EAW12309.1 conserved hypothetical protein [Aspergillus clavatus NRRL 1]